MQVSDSIFLSYRRSDSASDAGRIYDYLERDFGREHIFRDVDSIPIGVNFRKTLEDAIECCRVLLIVIGPSWLNTSDTKGVPRLYTPNDWVRIEIECALRRGIAIIPILVNETEMPNQNELPDSIQALTDYQAINVRPDPDFRADMKRLIDGIRPLLDSVQTSTTRKTTAENSLRQFRGRFKQRVDGEKLNQLLAPFANQATAAKQSEAKTYIGSLNRSQQAFYIEHGTFAQNFDELGLNIAEETENYRYSSELAGHKGKIVINGACPKTNALKGYIGIVGFDDRDRLITTLCEADSSGIHVTAMLVMLKAMADAGVKELIPTCPLTTHKI